MRTARDTVSRRSQRSNAESDARRRSVADYEETDLSVGALVLVDHPIVQAARLRNHGAVEGIR